MEDMPCLHGHFPHSASHDRSCRQVGKFGNLIDCAFGVAPRRALLPPHSPKLGLAVSLFLVSNCWEPLRIGSLIFEEWHRLCRARICRFIFSPARNTPPPLRHVPVTRVCGCEQRAATAQDCPVVPPPALFCPVLRGQAAPRQLPGEPRPHGAACARCVPRGCISLVSLSCAGLRGAGGSPLRMGSLQVTARLCGACSDRNVHSCRACGTRGARPTSGAGGACWSGGDRSASEGSASSKAHLLLASDMPRGRIPDPP